MRTGTLPKVVMGSQSGPDVSATRRKGPGAVSASGYATGAGRVVPGTAGGIPTKGAPDRSQPVRLPMVAPASRGRNVHSLTITVRQPASIRACRLRASRATFAETTAGPTRFQQITKGPVAGTNSTRPWSAHWEGRASRTKYPRPTSSPKSLTGRPQAWPSQPPLAQR